MLALNCRRLFQVTVLRKTVTCSADSRKSQHRQISTHRIRQNVSLPGDFQKPTSHTYESPCPASRPCQPQNSTSPRLDMVSGMCRPWSLLLRGRSCILCLTLSGRDLQFFFRRCLCGWSGRLLYRLLLSWKQSSVSTCFCRYLLTGLAP